MKLLTIFLLTVIYTGAKAQALNFAEVPSTTNALQGVAVKQFAAGNYNAAAGLQAAQPVNPAHATSSFGFFCRQELKMDKRTAMPVRFRLGSMEQCNRLEGKNR